MKIGFKLVIATVLFAAVHSGLASLQAKRFASRLFGQRMRNAWYRPMYLLQSVASAGLLYGYARRLPDRTLYDLKRSQWVPLLQAARIGAILYAVWAAHEVGLAEILGLRSLSAWAEKQAEVPPEPEAQGPALVGQVMKVTGPFRMSRHPLNLSPLPVLWLRPRMTRNLLLFNLLATAYLILGSVHEESRLEIAYGDAYRRYQHSYVPFYLPSLRPN
jgi:methanethiol S-methyltransferase